MTNPMAKTVWEAYVTWATAQSYLRLYQEATQEVEIRLRAFTEEQRTVFTQLVALVLPSEKKGEKTK